MMVKQAWSSQDVKRVMGSAGIRALLKAATVPEVAPATPPNKAPDVAQAAINGLPPASKTRLAAILNDKTPQKAPGAAKAPPAPTTPAKVAQVPEVAPKAPIVAKAPPVVAKAARPPLPPRPVAPVTAPEPAPVIVTMALRRRPAKAPSLVGLPLTWSGGASQPSKAPLAPLDDETAPPVAPVSKAVNSTGIILALERREKEVRNQITMDASLIASMLRAVGGEALVGDVPGPVTALMETVTRFIANRALLQDIVRLLKYQ